MQKLTEYTICLSLPGYGQDTVRYWEAPAHGAMLFSQKLGIVIENDFVDGESAVFFGSVGEMRERLSFLLANREYAERIAMAGRERFDRFHTSDARARQMLERMEMVM
jgi:spore maturation protein CgeB